MGKLILISILIATVAIAARAAREPIPAQGLKRLLLYLCLFNAAYLFAVAVAYQHL